jgi:hypothetical protein
MLEPTAVYGELPDFSGDRRNEDNSFLKGQDLGVPGESNDKGDGF